MHKTKKYNLFFKKLNINSAYLNLRLIKFDNREDIWLKNRFFYNLNFLLYNILYFKFKEKNSASHQYR